MAVSTSVVAICKSCVELDHDNTVNSTHATVSRNLIENSPAVKKHISTSATFSHHGSNNRYTTGFPITNPIISATLYSIN